MKKITRTSCALLCLVALLSGALAYTILYQLDVSNTMKLKFAYMLELRNLTTQAVIASYDWGQFEHSQGKSMLDGTPSAPAVALYNVGNVEVTVYVDCTPNLAPEWTLIVEGNAVVNKAFYTTDGTHNTFTLAPNASMELVIRLTELTAVPGQDYSFTLNFEVVTP
jgi:hypothetical protein